MLSPENKNVRVGEFRFLVRISVLVPTFLHQWPPWFTKIKASCGWKCFGWSASDGSFFKIISPAIHSQDQFLWGGGAEFSQELSRSPEVKRDFLPWWHVYTYRSRWLPSTPIAPMRKGSGNHPQWIIIKTIFICSSSNLDGIDKRSYISRIGYPLRKSSEWQKVDFLVNSYVLSVFTNGEKNSAMMNIAPISLIGKKDASAVGNWKNGLQQSQKSMVTEDWSKCTVIPLRIFPLEKRIISLRYPKFSTLLISQFLFCHIISINTERVDNKKIIVECYVPDNNYQQLPYECKQPIWSGKSTANFAIN